MELVCIFLACCCLALIFQMHALRRRVQLCEDRFAGVDIIADQVSDLCGDVYGRSGSR